MKLDPIIACPNETQLFGWAFLHDFVAHPFMAITLWSPWSLRFHNWTSLKAWPSARLIPPEFSHAWIPLWHRADYRRVGQGLYEVLHPRVDHSFRCQAKDASEALSKAVVYFSELAAMYGGQFSLPLFSMPPARG